MATKWEKFLKYWYEFFFERNMSTTSVYQGKLTINEPKMVNFQDALYKRFFVVVLNIIHAWGAVNLGFGWHQQILVT